MKNKTRRAATAGGIIAVIGILIGMMLNLPVGDVGTQDDSNPESDVENAKVSLETDLIAQNDSASTPDQPEDKTNEPTTDVAAAANVVYVLIDGRTYSYATDAKADITSYKPIELAELVALAKKTTGNENGVRIRISRKKAARVSAQESLLEQLEKADIKNDAVVVVEEWVD